ncbi:MAG: OmpH family outer membrane protein [Sphingobacteriia bacterium]|nr:OmpH family outer membrane protein [Sphingobacteriia bacterium]
MKTASKFLFVIALVLFSFGAQAQKFGHLDFAKLYSEMPGLDSAQAKYKDYAEQLRKQLGVMQTELESKYADYQANAATMSAIIKQTKEKEMSDLNERIQAFNGQAQQDLAAKETELTAPIIEKARTAVREVAKANGYTYIFNSAEGLLLYSQDSDDILPLVKKKLGITK